MNHIPTSRQQTIYLIRESVLFLGLSFLFLLFSSKYSFLKADLTLGFNILLTLIVFAWIYFKKVQSTPLLIPLMIFLGVYFLAAILSVDIRRSLSEVYYLSIPILLFALFADLSGRGWTSDLILKVLLLVGALISVFLWMDAFQWYFEWFKASSGRLIPDITYRLMFHNVIASLLNPLIFISITKVFSVKKRFHRFLLIINSFSLMGLSYLTSSRSAWLGMAAGFVVIALFVLSFYRQWFLKTFEWLKRRKVILVLLIFLFIAAAGVMVIMLYKQTIHPTHSQSFIGARWVIWSPAWKTFLQHPLLGQGPGTFAISYMRTYSVPPNVMLYHAHSIFFNLLAETGILGFTAFIFLLGMVLRYLLRTIKESLHPNWTSFAAGMAALIGMCVHCVFDDFRVDPMGLWMFSILFGAVLGGNRNEHYERKIRPWLALLLPLAAWINLWILMPFDRGTAAANRNDWNQSVVYFQEAVRRDPLIVASHQQLALAYSQAQPPVIHDSIQEFEVAVRMDPYWSLNHANLGSMYFEDGNLSAAEAELRKAVQLAPQAGLYYLKLGEILEAENSLDEARASYRMALNLRPDFYPAYFWRSSGFRLQISREWALQNTPPAPSLSELESMLSGARQQAAYYFPVIERYIGMGELEKAQTLLQQAGLTYFSTRFEPLEMLWLQAQLDAADGNFGDACLKGSYAFERFLTSQYEDAGFFSDSRAYLEEGLRRPATQVNLVPSLVLIPVTDRWGERGMLAGSWCETSGDMERACSGYRSINKYIPDLVDAQEKLDGLGECIPEE